MPRVFLTCGDTALIETLRKIFNEVGDFEICVEHKSGIEAIMEAIDLHPDLVILGAEMPPVDDLQIAEALKLCLPEVQVFLVTERQGMESEKKALSHGIDAVFERQDGFGALLMNARAACGVA
jgi:DNA-binding NarL/FixJ family response regulator